MPEPKSGLTLSESVIAKLRIEKAHLIAQSGEFRSYDDLVEMLLAHWQQHPPATVPGPSDLKKTA